MSKFEEWLADKHLGSMELEFAKAAWNARGKVDAEICRELHHSWHIDDESGPKECADAIEKENEQ